MTHTAHASHMKNLNTYIDLTKGEFTPLEMSNFHTQIFQHGHHDYRDFQAPKMEMQSNVGFIPSSWELLSHIVDYVGHILCDYDSKLEQASIKNPNHLVFKILKTIEDKAKIKDEASFDRLIEILCSQNFKGIERSNNETNASEIEHKWLCNALTYCYQKALLNKIRPSDQISMGLIKKPIQAFKSPDSLQAHCLCLYEISKFKDLIGCFWNPQTISLLTQAVNIGRWETTILACAVMNNIIGSKDKTEEQVQACLHAVSPLSQFHPNADIKAWSYYFTQRAKGL